MFNVGILGAGWIARKMAETLAGTEGAQVSAIASRDKAKADSFAAEWSIARSYGSYRELVDDPDIDLIYVATPHSHHFEHASLAVEAGKPVLCEKAFTANAREAGSPALCRAVTARALSRATTAISLLRTSTARSASRFTMTTGWWPNTASRTGR